MSRKLYPLRNIEITSRSERVNKTFEPRLLEWKKHGKNHKKMDSRQAYVKPESLCTLYFLEWHLNLKVPYYRRLIIAACLRETYKSALQICNQSYVVYFSSSESNALRNMRT